MQEIEKELNDKGISLDILNTLNKEYEQKIQELRKELNDKDKSLNEYKKRLDTLDNRHKQEIQELKKELKESDTKDKNKVLIKVNELNKINDEYIKEKQIKEQELQNNTREINDLRFQNILLKGRLD